MIYQRLSIKWVYFDVGGVVVKDFSQTNKWEELKKDLGVTKQNHEAFERVWNKYEGEICLNRDVDSLVPILKKEVGLDTFDNYSMLQDFINRFEVNQSLWPVINKIKRTCKIGLLTNMYPRMFNSIKQAKLLPPVNWDVVIDSSVVKYQKPDKKIFEVAQVKAKTPPENILFVENSQIHIETAKKLGWQTFWYDSADYEKSSQDLTRFYDKNN